MHELRRGGLFTATPVTRVCINWLICLIHSGLLSKRKRKKKEEKSRLQRMFPRHHVPKSGFNQCCHKLTPIISPCVLLVLPFPCFPFNACSIPGGRKACLFGLVGLCLALLLSLLSLSVPRILLRSSLFEVEGKSLPVSTTLTLCLLPSTDFKERHGYLPGVPEGRERQR